METAEKADKQKAHTNGITKIVPKVALEWPEHITEIDISNKNIRSLEDKVKLPTNLVRLNISFNELTEVPNPVLILEKLKSLNMSNNRIQYFDDTPNFNNTIEELDLSNNNLYGPPYWVWTQSPQKLTDIDLSYNPKLTQSFKDGYLEELLQYTTLVRNIKINNCYLTHHLKLIKTFKNAKVLELGSSNLSLFSVNRMTEVPCEGLNECCDIEYLNLSSVQIYTINTNIDVLSKLVEINLSQNEISNVPDEFCNLLNLEVCDLSFNHLLYLPDNIGNLKKLSTLRMNSNELCMLPDSIGQLVNLRILDLYDNCLYEIPDMVEQTKEIDLAQNYFDEPQEVDYLERKEKLRLNLPERYDGKKVETERPESEKSYEETDDEEIILSSRSNQDPQPACNDPPSSPEDWDSDDYWVPRFCKQATPPPHSPWLYFVKKKMEEGNFCPMDIHPVSIVEKVRYEKLCKPKVVYESDGQFDDYSDDNS